MKRIIFAAVSIAAMAAAGSAFAAPSQSTATLMQGNVPDTCVLNPPTFAASFASNAALAGNGGQSTILLNLTDPNTAKLNGVTFTLTYADSYCNYAHSVGVQATNGGLIATDYDPVATSAPFIRRIGYNAEVKWFGPAFAQGPKPKHSTTSDLGDNAQQAAFNFPVAGANRADLVVQVGIDNADQTPVVSGTYIEILTIRMAATL